MKMIRIQIDAMEDATINKSYLGQFTSLMEHSDSVYVESVSHSFLAVFEV